MSESDIMAYPSVYFPTHAHCYTVHITHKYCYMFQHTGDMLGSYHNKGVWTDLLIMFCS